MDAIKIISQNVGQTVSLIIERAAKDKAFGKQAD